MVKRRHPEQAFQAQLVRALTSALTPETYFFAVPNGGKRTPIEAAIFVGQGVKPGVPDLLFIHDGRAYGLELKADKGRVTEIQRIVHDRLRSVGMRVGVARTLDEAFAFLRDCGIPLRLA